MSCCCIQILRLAEAALVCQQGLDACEGHGCFLCVWLWCVLCLCGV